MKKIFLTAILISLLIVPGVNVLAQGAAQSPPANLDVMTLLDRVVDWLFTILLVIAAIAIIIAAYYFVTAAGNPETVSKARNFVLYALIGVAVAVASRGLVALARTIVGT